MNAMTLAYTVAAPEADAGRLPAWGAPLAQSFPFLTHLGYRGVELMVPAPETFDAPSTRSLATQHGLEIVAVSTGPIALERGLSLSDADPAARAEAIRAGEAALRLCASLGAMMTLGAFRGRCAPGEIEAAQVRLADSLRRLLPVAEELDTRICLEPQNRFQSSFFRTVSEALPFIESLGSGHLGFSLDSFHMNLEENNFEEAVRLAGPRTFYVQVADNHRGPPGSGMLDFGRFRCALDHIGYQGWFAIEIDQKPSPEAAARAAIQGWRQLFPKRE